MRHLRLTLVTFLLLALALASFGFQRGVIQAPRGGFNTFGNNPFSIASQPGAPAEFYFSRLRYNSLYGGGGFGRRGGGGGFGGWSQDYPRADEDCLVMLRRLTRIAAPAPLHVADIDSDSIYDYPWIYGVGVDKWAFTDDEAKRLRNYLNRGGFLMVDNFHGPAAWAAFMAGMTQVLPDAVVEDLADNDEIYHVLYSIDEKFQIPGEVYTRTGRTYERDDATVPIWRGIRDKNGRIIVAITANMHLGDAWEWANTPYYPEKFSGLAFRIVVNYITYSMTH